MKISATPDQNSPADPTWIRTSRKSHGFLTCSRDTRHQCLLLRITPLLCVSGGRREESPGNQALLRAWGSIFAEWETAAALPCQTLLPSSCCLVLTTLSTASCPLSVQSPLASCPCLLVVGAESCCPPSKSPTLFLKSQAVSPSDITLVTSLIPFPLLLSDITPVALLILFPLLTCPSSPT